MEQAAADQRCLLTKLSKQRFQREREATTNMLLA
jgi:hypothetical protein